MPLNKIHKINPNANVMFGGHGTFCGLSGMRETFCSTEYGTTQGNIFEATTGTKGVTCAKCRKGRWTRTDDPTGASL